jgi:hypothetical protein
MITIEQMEKDVQELYRKTNELMERAHQTKGAYEYARYILEKFKEKEEEKKTA